MLHIQSTQLKFSRPVGGALSQTARNLTTFLSCIFEAALFLKLQCFSPNRNVLDHVGHCKKDLAIIGLKCQNG